MSFHGVRIVVTGAGRDFGRSVALHFADRGAEVFLAARSLDAAERVRDEIAARGNDSARAFACDLSDPASVAAFAAAVAEQADRVDVLVNNGARWLEGEDILAASDDEIVATLDSGATGTVLAVKHFLPLLRASGRPDIVNMISVCGDRGFSGSSAHDAFYAAKSAQAGFAGILSKRLRPEGIRVISLYPPDFRNADPLSPGWDATPRGPHDLLTAQSLLDCIAFALAQPRDCFITSFHFEPVVSEEER
jgi:NAD(P)-dependent dehydrogenase (short-subunit alcohol dehydrogenase family)